MTISDQKKWLMVSLFGLAQWFFGNLYEAVVFSPNWVINSPEQIRRLNEFFMVTSPTLYFVPFTQLATILVWYIFWRNKEVSIHNTLKLASIFAVLATVLNIITVYSAAFKLFETNYAAYGEYLTTLTWRWNIMNIIRTGMVMTTIYFLFQSYRKLDALVSEEHS